MSRTNALSENDGSLIVSPLALFTCLQWLEDEAHLERLEFKDKGNVRNALAHLLGEADFWLRVHGGPAAACEVRRILKDFQDPSATPFAQGNRTSLTPPDPPPLQKIQAAQCKKHQIG
ncbi:hypothetical protein H2199_008625 [Coniosporium tulheliwenetii]|uniref:Uncharacterized protein n=1 Tax=Coniosporium tulheliwenetii TaxID=3383036 RepID=A0ACC2YIF8_9PEZI|nr:hypothetical protein H2199_008625 [Cladosporium sp. JES 115]